MDHLQHLVEQLAGAADEGQADAVFVAARRFADEHDAACRIAVGEDGMRCRPLQRAALETFQCGFQLGERVSRRGRRTARYRWNLLHLPLEGGGRTAKRSG